ATARCMACSARTGRGRRRRSRCSAACWSRARAKCSSPARSARYAPRTCGNRSATCRRSSLSTMTLPSTRTSTSLPASIECTPSGVKAAQGGRVHEIRADNPLRAVAVLKQEMEPWRVSLFGDRFHVIVDGDAQAAVRRLEERLARDGIRVLEAIEQDYSLEDVFLAIAEKGALAA